MTFVPDKAFVLAAGFGTRMRPLTENCPKPLLEVGGQSMLNRALDALAAAGVQEAVVNAHYLADQVTAHVRDRSVPKIHVSVETEILDTAGGVQPHVPFFDNRPFYVLNADVVWEDGPATSALARLAAAWDDARMDILLLLHPVPEGTGDYYLPEGTMKPVFAAHGAHPANTVFAGPRIVHPRVFDGVAAGKRSFLDLFHAAEAAGRLAGLRHDGAWHHISTPVDFEKTNALFAARAGQLQVKK